jgi:hypothetical protein
MQALLNCTWPQLGPFKYDKGFFLTWSADFLFDLFSFRFFAIPQRKVTLRAIGITLRVGKQKQGTFLLALAILVEVVCLLLLALHRELGAVERLSVAALSSL